MQVSISSPITSSLSISQNQVTLNAAGKRRLPPVPWRDLLDEHKIRALRWHVRQGTWAMSMTSRPMTDFVIRCIASACGGAEFATGALRSESAILCEACPGHIRLPVHPYAAA